MSTQKLADFITGLKYDSLPSEVVAQAKRAVMDHVGVMLAATDSEATVAARKFAEVCGGKEESTVIGSGVKVSPNLAAMVNTTAMRAFDMDDGAYKLIGHLAHAGAIVIASSLAVAERQATSGKDFITAVVAGYEVTLRAGWLIRLFGFYAPAGMAGCYGAATVTSKLLNLSPEETAAALGIAEAHCLAPSRAKDIGRIQMTKEAAAWGAMTGVSAALLAGSGFRGPHTIFDLPDYHQTPLESLGQDWEIKRLYFKPYSCCRFTHASIDGVLELVDQHGLKADDIHEVTLKVASQAVAEMSYVRPQNTWEAQFSFPFTVGAALSYGEVGPEQVGASSLDDKAILKQAAKVRMVADPEADAVRPGMIPSRIIIETKAGKKFETFVPFPKGSPENPLTEEELRNKFWQLTTKAIGIDKAEGLSRCLDNLESLNDINQMVDNFKVSNQ